MLLMYISRADRHWASNWGALSWRRLSRPLSISWLSAVFLCKVEVERILSCLLWFCLCLLLSFSSHSNDHGGENLCVASNITRRDSLTANTLILWLLQSFCLVFQNVHRAWGTGVFLHRFIGAGLDNPAFWLNFSVMVSIYCKEIYLHAGWGL